MQHKEQTILPSDVLPFTGKKKKKFLTFQKVCTCNDKVVILANVSVLAANGPVIPSLCLFFKTMWKSFTFPTIINYRHAKHET